MGSAGTANENRRRARSAQQKSCRNQINQREGLASTVVAAAAEAFDEERTGLGIAAHVYGRILPRNRPAGKEVFPAGGDKV